MSHAASEATGHWWQNVADLTTILRMKNRFSTLDVCAAVHDLKKLVGLRVINVYDVDSKTYLIRMQKSDEKCFIMLESGCRIHKTSFDWPKSQFPASFSMKLRKHIRQKRLECVTQLGVDRIVDMQFGGDERACHVIVELYDRGNVLLTDNKHIILNVLRPRTDKDTDVRFSVREQYPVGNARQSVSCTPAEKLLTGLKSAKKGESLKRFLAPLTHFGPALIEHSLRAVGIPSNAQIGVNIGTEESDAAKLFEALQQAQQIFDEVVCSATPGYLTYKVETRTDGVSVETYQEFHPFKFSQLDDRQTKKFDSFSECVDEFFSKLESQKADLKALNAEREAVKKLNNVIKDQQDRIALLELTQVEKEEMAKLIELNSELVDKALLVIRSAIANQLSWEAIEEMRVKACEAGDPVASSIVGLDLDSNKMTLLLKDPYYSEVDPKKVTIDIAMSSHQNVRKLHTEKKAAVEKQRKTVCASTKALKSAQLKTKETLEAVRSKTEIMKKRRVMWFEKFFWFVSSENYLVIGGRDAQQNELLVKRYLRPGDIYVHADVRGASSIVIRNKLGREDIPPRTLNEAGTMAVCYSSAWEAKVTAAAWWVHQHQVSRTAPTGEYLTPGSFMIRGKKNYLPACQLQMGFGLMFKLDEDSLERHIEERKVSSMLAEDDALKEGDVEDGGLSLNESNSDEEKDLDDEIEDFPDVQVNLRSIVREVKGTSEDDDYTIIQVGPSVERKPAPKAVSGVQDEDRNVDESKESGKIRPMTTRQKHKATKMRKKYGDQDEEERRLRLMLLGSKPKDVDELQGKNSSVKLSERTKRNVRENKAVSSSEVVTQIVGDEIGGLATEGKVEPPSASKEDEDDELLEADVALMDVEETKMLNSLTWRPVDEDVLLFAVVVVAPYQTMHNFKYKVKLTPGTGKRGKAAKSAIALFQRDKSANAQEQSLLKVLSTDDTISRNIPGKVRVSAPQLNRK